jgi:hypothetical protein
MKRFPAGVKDSMEATGATTTCVAVQIDKGEWETAIFFQVGGPESKVDRRILTHSTNPIPTSVEADLIEHEAATVVLLRLEVQTVADDPLVGEILIAPGHTESQFETLKWLTRQHRLLWFFADRAYWIIHSQQSHWGDAERAGFKQLLADVTHHDALIRVTGRYDANAALQSIVANYELREGAMRTEYQVSRGSSDKPGN